jgi:hypothetical protein
MQKIFTILKALVLLTICSSTALAEPKSGFGLSVGGTSNNMSGTTIPGGVAYSYSSSGLSVGMDYQFAVSKSFSINPLLMSSGEDAIGTTLQTGTVAGHGFLGLQLRYWLDNFFIGGHVGKYVELLSVATTVNGSTTTTDTVGSGSGRGIVIGWEPSSSKWFVMGQVDSASISYLSADVKQTGARISVGYRWK